ncbi:BatA domain-containing protein [Sunxiuqinia sp. A32]|uniref:BatA domain-containing protein n=1 Tax=Sunxiuqinia sp. A32 TaxID=3461496 RepID=UPI00404547CB
MIKFIYPEFLLALAALLIPLIIHFFHFKRYKTVFFSQVGFLKAVQQDTRKKSDLKKLLILISRLLMLALLVIAFTRPYLSSHDTEAKQNKQTVALYLDNSFSMNQEGINGPLLEEAKTKAVNIANAFEPGTDFLLLTNNATPKELLPINREQLIQRISATKESPKSLSLSETINLINKGLSSTASNNQRNIYLLSDFQAHEFDNQEVKWDSLSHHFLIRFSGQSSNNLMIDSCWFETPGRKSGQHETLFVKIKNQSEQSIQNQAVRLSINDSLKAISSLQLEPAEEKIVTLSYRNNMKGFHLGKVELDDYPIIYDNNFYFSYQVKPTIKILLIYNPEEGGIKQLETLFENDSLIQLETIEDRKVQTSALAQSDFVVLLNVNTLGSGLSKAISDFIKNGGTTCILPGKQINTDDYNLLYSQCKVNPINGIDTTRIRMNSLNYKHRVFNNVFEQEQKDLKLPEVNFRYQFKTISSVKQEAIISLINGESAITDYPVGKGHLYNFSFPVNSNEFIQEAIFVPLLYNMAINSLETQAISYTIDNSIISEVRKEQTDTPPFEIKKIAANESFRIPVLNESANYARLNFSQLIEEAGIYELTSDEEIVSMPAFNFNRKESLNNKLSVDQINELIDENNWLNVKVLNSELPDFEQQIKQIQNGKELWLLFVILSLVFIGIETAIIRWMK